MVKFVVSTAMLKCNRGTTPAPLIADVLTMSIGPGLNTATVRANIPGRNIFPFGHCRLVNGPCVPITSLPWSGGSPGVFFNNAESLTSNGKLKCEVGGTINVSDPGQHSVHVGALQDQYFKNVEILYPSDDKPADGSSFGDIMKGVLPVAAMVAAADGPLPFGDGIAAGVLGGTAVVAIVAQSESSDDSEQNGDDAGDYYQEKYEHAEEDYTNAQPTEKNMDRLKGGKQSQRDNDYGLPKGFWRWWDKSGKSDPAVGGEIRNRRDAHERYDEWIAAGKPQV